MNVVSLMGRITKDPDVRQSGETSVTRFTVAVDRRFKREGEDSADFISCVAFGKTADFVGKYFTKGSRIALTGRIQTGSYTNKDGNKVYTTDVIAESVEFCESKKSESKPKKEEPQDDGFVSVDDGFEDIDELPFQ